MIDKVLSLLDAERERHLARLMDLVRQPSVSATGEGVEECAGLVRSMMEEAGFEVRFARCGKAAPLIYGQILNPKAKRTILIYAHYDVQPPEPLELWETSPFEPVVKDGRLWARGAADDKSQLYAAIAAAQAWRRIAGRAPVNLKVLFDGEEETSSSGLFGFVRENGELLRTDLVWVSDGEYDCSGRPALTFGARGILYIELKVRGAAADCHSGMFGGLAPNPAWRLVGLLATMKVRSGRVLVEGFYDGIRPMSRLEAQALAENPYDGELARRYLGAEKLDVPEGTSAAEALMFRPTLNICGLASGYGGPGSKTIIPSQAIVKMDIRLVVDQDPGEMLDKVKRHLARHGFGDVEIVQHGAMKPVKTDMGHPAAGAAVKAVEMGFGATPVKIPSAGGSVPTYIFQEALGAPVITVPYANADCNMHAPNENMDLESFYKGMRTTAAGMATTAEI